jgi:hypothetical protein
VSRKVGTGYVEGLFDSSPKMTKASNLNLWHFISKWDVAHFHLDHIELQADQTALLIGILQFHP